MNGMSRFWMVRAGEGGHLFDQFEAKGCIGLGWAGDYSGTKTLQSIKNELKRQYPGAHPGARANWASILNKFLHVMQPGDRIVTYDPSSRKYLLGTVKGDARHDPALLNTDHAWVRPVDWNKQVPRDALGATAKNTLGSTLTLFAPGEDVLAEMEGALEGGASKAVEAEEVEEQEEEFEIIRRDTLSRSHEFIKDRILALDAGELEELAAALLRAMGYRARVTPKGPDRGRDVIASPDGLGFQQPRIFAEVKHRKNDAMGSQAIRGFVGGLRTGDRGLFISTGGFTQEAKYEAERSAIPVTLLNLDDLATLVVEHYDGFDAAGRALLPLIRVYWPASRG